MNLVGVILTIMTMLIQFGASVLRQVVLLYALSCYAYKNNRFIKFVASSVQLSARHHNLCGFLTFII